MNGRIVKRVELLGVIDEQQDDCFAHVRPVNYTEKIENIKTDFSAMKDEEAAAYEETFVKEHFVRGKFRVFNDNGDSELVDLKIEDVVSSVDLLDALYYAVLGVDVDPKAIREMANLPTLPQTEQPPTETSSSEASPTPTNETTAPTSEK